MKEETKSNIYLTITGFSILILLFTIYRFSFQFIDRQSLDENTILLFVSILIFASSIYLLTIKIVNKWNILSILIIIVFGIIFRIIFIYSSPILENDYFRYLWDGAVLANNQNPYQFSPNDTLEKNANDDLESLSIESGEIIENINNPHLKTIYPPIAQIFFAASYKISPWNLIVWKFILLFFDLITLFLLFLTFIKLKIPLKNILIYWWNPLLIKEIFNSAHMDSLLFPFVLGSMLLFIHNRKRISSLIFSLAVGLKIWPVFIFPTYLQSLIKSPKKLFINLVIFTIPISIFVLSILNSKPDLSSGFVAYGISWENNSSIFKIILSLTESVLDFMNIHIGHAQNYSRIIISLILGIWIFYWSFINKTKDIYSKALYIIGFAYLISPTQFPWYYTWLIPFLAIRPRWSILALTFFLPLYYISYYLEKTGSINLFNSYIVWFEFAPVWIFILIEYRYRRRLKIEN